MSMTVEYLVLFNKAEGFCDSDASFNRLLSVHSSLKVTGTTLEHDDVIYAYHAKGWDVTGKDQRYFRLRLTWDDDGDDSTGLDKFSACARVLRTTVGRAQGQIEVLRDDVAFFYSQQAYPLIYRLENLMRNLIATFMLTTVGRTWVREATPSEVKEALAKTKRKASDPDTGGRQDEFLNVLQTVDFCHLGAILFAKYTNRPVEGLEEVLKNAKGAEDIKSSALADFVPQSNWQRYFSSLVSCEDGYLRSRWDELYDLRCKIAHNVLFTKADFQRLTQLVSEVEPKIEEAISELPSVNVPENELEALAESAARRLSESIGVFIGEWQKFEETLVRKSAERGQPNMHGYKAIDELQRLKLLEGRALKDLDNIRRFRNRVVHGPLHDVTPGTIEKFTQELQGINHELEESPPVDPTAIPPKPPKVPKTITRRRRRKK